MKITAAQLRQIIREEIRKVSINETLKNTTDEAVAVIQQKRKIKTESVNEAGNMLVYRVNADKCESFLRKYPKVRQAMTTIASKNKDLMKGYKAFLKFKDANEGYLGGRAEVTKSPSFGEKTFWKYDWMGTSGWAEIYQYIHSTKLESVNEAIMLDKNMKAEIEQSIDMGFNTLKVGMISAKRKGVMLTNKKYEVRGVYPIEYKSVIQSIIDSKKK